jgi:hypothetical protein
MPHALHLSFSYLTNREKSSIGNQEVNNVKAFSNTSLQYRSFIRWWGGDLYRTWGQWNIPTVRISVENSASSRTLAIWEVNIKTVCKKCVNVEWTELGQGRAEWLRRDLLRILQRLLDSIKPGAVFCTDSCLSDFRLELATNHLDTFIRLNDYFGPKMACSLVDVYVFPRDILQLY